MARFTALQRVRLKRNIYRAARYDNIREAFAEGQTGFISRVPPNNQYVQHDDNCIYYIMLDSGFTEGAGGYPMDEAGWLVLATEIEDIDERARLEALAAEMRRVSDEYWDVGQPSATLTSTPHPTVAPPPRQGYAAPQVSPPTHTVTAWIEEMANPVMEIADPSPPRPVVGFSPIFTPEVSNYQGVQITGAWLDEQSDRVDAASWFIGT